MNSISFPNLPYNAIICRYNEIAIKGRNRTQFENMLIAGLRRCLKPIGSLRVLRERGRIFLQRKDGAPFTSDQGRIIGTGIPYVTGLASASPGFLLPPDPEAVKTTILTSFPAVYDTVAARIGGNRPIRYSMRARRNNKAFPLTSKELEIAIADVVLDAYPRLTVDLRNAELCVQAEIRRNRAFVFYETLAGPGGLPGGSGGHLLALLSGGIDSPVACYQMLKRGCTLDYITFHSAPYTPPALLDKVSAIARELNRYQHHRGRLVAVNLLEAQKEIRDRTDSRFRTLLYRRLMVRIATRIAEETGSLALVTGDNLGQVASQTLENLAAVSEASTVMILRPVLSWDKYQTVAVAEERGLFALSKDPVPDSCTVFAPRNPATAARLSRLIAEEKRIDCETLLAQSLSTACEVDLETCEEQPLFEESL